MLYVLRPDNVIDVFDDYHALLKATSQCPCDSCDVACSWCSPVASCPHDADGHAGGLCVSAPTSDADAPSWKRLKYYPAIVASMDCGCRETCEHMNAMLRERDARGQGVRPGGLVKRARLRAIQPPPSVPLPPVTDDAPPRLPALAERAASRHRKLPPIVLPPDAA